MIPPGTRGYGLGVRIYGLGALATGLVGLAWGDFALQWEPVPADFPVRTALAYIFSALLVLGGAAVNWRPSATLGAVALSGLYAMVVAFMHGANIVRQPGAFATWSGAAEQVALLAGGLTAFACLGGVRGGGARDWGLLTNTLLRSGVLAMGVCLLVFGLAHFLYLDFTASMVPSWIPGGQRSWAAFTGAAHIAAGVAILTGVAARPAAILLTAMFAGFGLLVHLPLLLGDPSHLNWVMNAVNLALTGAAWTIADALTKADASATGRASAHPLVPRS
jgi:uncharacterized membrane protein YphA (DoxX/SURF4 family)